MSKSDRFISPPGSCSEGGKRGTRKGGGLLQRLLQAFARPPDRGAHHPFTDSLMPEGHRSGVGVRSIERYLDHARNTRPGPLE